MTKISTAKVDPKSVLKLAALMERVYGSWKDIIWRSFVSGVFGALGATVGLALVVIVLSFILDQLGVLPVVGDFFSRLNAFINSPFQNN